MSLIQLFPKNLNTRAIEAFHKGRNITLSGVSGYSARACVIADIQRASPDIEHIVWIVNDRTECENIAREMRLWSDTTVSTHLLPEEKPIEETSIGVFSRPDQRAAMVKKIELVSKLMRGKKEIIVTPFQHILLPLPEKGEVQSRMLSLAAGQNTGVVELIEALIAIGYVVGDDESLQKGTYRKNGGVLSVSPANMDAVVHIEVEFDHIGKIFIAESALDTPRETRETIEIFPVQYEKEEQSFVPYLSDRVLVIEDELDILDDVFAQWESFAAQMKSASPTITFTPFNEDTRLHEHLHYISFMTYRSVFDFANDLRDKKRDRWKTLLFTKNQKALANVLNTEHIPYSDELKRSDDESGRIYVVGVPEEAMLPHAFQNPEHRIALITDKEIAILREEKKKIDTGKAFMDFLTGLKVGDYAVHADHGIGQFLGLEQREIDGVKREYLKLGYAENDRLYVPIDQADKVNKYIGTAESMPHLTRLGSTEWATITKKVQKETEEIAKELLELYAKRKAAKGIAFPPDSEIQGQFEETFPYEETPGQIRAIIDTKKDMESSTPMDRLICGDVGFGKTEVAMRAAFKAVQGGQQVALISPITILADQHYRSFKKRMDAFHVRVEMLSRFKTAREQEDIVKRLAKGEVDIVIGTHRLLQPDIQFKDLGLVVVDEEQRFGVKQKEKLKQLRTEVDVLTLTATPIPRTLHICLNKVRDVTTITTPPPGRLPIITEVRKFSMELIREAILREIQRGGQIYFLHNRVATIDSMADKLRALIPEATFGVTHGKLDSDELEERILAFKDHKFDVLVTSTIIENGIDLPNANTLIVNHAEKFGLAQLHQLRGRVGRGKVQAYAYFLYHGERLKLDAKKRLRAIVESSELGAGFQIAMKDLEIRGAGDILGARQHGTINVVGVSHFIRMLNKTIEDLKAGKITEAQKPQEVSVELPIPAYIPDSYIVSFKDKINTYQRMAAADTLEYLNELRHDLTVDYGKLPLEVSNLFRIIELKIYAKQAGIVAIKVENIHAENKRQEVVFQMSDKVRPPQIMKLLDYNPRWQISGTKLRLRLDEAGMNWIDEVKESLIRLSQKVKA